MAGQQRQRGCTLGAGAVLLEAGSWASSKMPPGWMWLPFAEAPCGFCLLTPCRRVQQLFHSVQLNVNNPHFLIMQGRITKARGWEQAGCAS